MKPFIILIALLTSIGAMAGELSHKAKERISDILISISEHKEVRIDKNGKLKIAIEDQTIDVNQDLIKELKESGVLDDRIMAKDGARCTR